MCCSAWVRISCCQQQAQALQELRSGKAIGFSALQYLGVLQALCLNLGNIFGPDKISIGKTNGLICGDSTPSLSISAMRRLVCQIQFCNTETRGEHLLVIINGNSQRAGTCSTVSQRAEKQDCWLGPSVKQSERTAYESGTALYPCDSIFPGRLLSPKWNTEPYSFARAIVKPYPWIFL